MPPDHLGRLMYRKLLRLATDFDRHPLMKTLLTAPVEQFWNRNLNLVDRVRRPEGHKVELADVLVSKFAGGPCYLPVPAASLRQFVRQEFRETCAATESPGAFSCLRRLNTARDLYHQCVSPATEKRVYPPLQATLVTEDSIAGSTVLAAHPILLHEEFRQAVIWLVHSQDQYGMIGFVLNKYLDGEGADQLRKYFVHQLGCEFFRTVPLHYAGPVGQGMVLLHPYQELLAHSGEYGGGWDAGNGWWLQIVNENLITHLSQATPQLDPTNCRLLCGYTSWAEDQLQMELEQRAWVRLKVEPSSALSLYQGHPGATWDLTSWMWGRALASLGGEFVDIARLPALTAEQATALTKGLRFYQP
eukprot:EG_transcript_16868